MPLMQWSARFLADGCNSFWVSRTATIDGKAMLTHHSQITLMGGGRTARQVMFVAIPNDPKAHIVWMVTVAGAFGRGGFIVNDAGVANGLHASDSGQYSETLAQGLDVTLARFHALLYSDSAEQAAEIINIGTREYRKKTGRKTLLRTRGHRPHFWRC